MDEQLQPALGVIDEAVRGNVRIRLHRVRRNDGSLTCLVEVSAWNGWAGQSKLLQAWGGISADHAQELFMLLSKNVCGYDWHDEEILLV